MNATPLRQAPSDTAAERSRRGGRPSFGALVRSALVATWLPIVLVAAWWVLSAGSTNPFFPPLSRILETWWGNWVTGDATGQIFSSLRHLALGFVLGSAIGIVTATLLWRLPLLRYATSPIVYFLYVIPGPALLPAMIAVFGIGEARQVALIAFGAIWPTLLNTLDGMRGLSAITFDVARGMRLGGARTLFSVVLPGAAPQMVAGLRASLQVSIILMVVSEMVAANQGIGYVILQAQAAFAITTMWGGILTLAILGTILNLVFVLCERWLLSWHRRSRTQAA